jgi:hypothetical protein
MVEARPDSSFLRRYRRAYNRLDDVDDAYAQLLGEREHMTTIAELLRIIREEKAQSFLGVTLLHRHFLCGLDAVFVERRFTPRATGHAPVLVTSPVTIADAPKRLAAHRFAFLGSGELQPLEFTTDRTAIREANRLKDALPLRERIAKHLSSSGLATRLGVGVFPRDASVFDATHVFMEETRFDEVQSIVHVLPRLPRVAGRLIPTLWTAVDGGNGCCTQECLAYCLHPSPGEFGQGYCGHRKSGHIGCA